MARARNIKPGLYKNEDLAECSIWARFIFPGLWMLADREGRLEDRPRRIKGELLPFDIQDAEPLLKELEAHSFIIRYQNSDGAFIQISKFKEHQTPHYSEKPSVIKPHDFQETSQHEEPLKPEKSGEVPSLRGGHNPLTPDCLNPSSLNPDCLKKIGSAKRRTQIPNEFFPNDTGLQAIQKTNLDLKVELSKFMDHHKAKGSVMADWQAAWRTWVSNGVKFAPTQKQATTSFKSADDAKARERWEEMTGRVHPDNLPKNTVIDITPRMELTA